MAIERSYSNPGIETLAREPMRELQLKRLLNRLPIVHAHSPLIRQVWKAGGRQRIFILWNILP